MCHDSPATRAPGTASLHAMSPSFIVNALTNGIMQGPGAQPCCPRKEWRSSGIPDRAESSPMTLRWPGVALERHPRWLSKDLDNGWGANLENWRFQRTPGIAAADLNRLELKWAFGFPGAVAAFGQPTVIGGACIRRQPERACLCDRCGIRLLLLGLRRKHRRENCYYCCAHRQYRRGDVRRPPWETLPDRRCDGHAGVAGYAGRWAPNRYHRRPRAFRGPSLCSHFWW